LFHFSDPADINFSGFHVNVSRYIHIYMDGIALIL
jgi:hypothetical protein